MPAAPRQQWTSSQTNLRAESPILFSPPRAMKPVPASRLGSIITSSWTPPRGAEYFAFTPGTSPAPVAIPQVFYLAAKREEEKRQRQAVAALDEAWAARRVRDAAAEAAEALKCEIDWVRSSGILRDSQGNRDYTRTEAIREELRLSALEAVLIERWKTYETRWADLAGKAGRDRNKSRDVRFEDVPWPVCPTEGQSVTLADLTVDRVRGCTVTKKERVRSSLLRWHCDKITTVLARIVDNDVEAVREGIHALVLCLHQLNSRLETASG
ncbi:hypothetical protein B0H19DRAFT_1130493 [Mycena capillaripes]|nr:hypothetical protein B0H19DRAFT_1130493 [Mycena capillaripes]